MRLLIVDDIASIAEMFSRLMQKHGHQCYVCTDATQVVSITETIQPDAVLLDIAMPQLSGLQIAEEFKQRPEIRPKLLVAVTGYGDPCMREKIMAAGFDHHVVKPVQAEDLNAALSSLTVATTSSVPARAHPAP